MDIGSGNGYPAGTLSNFSPGYFPLYTFRIMLNKNPISENKDKILPRFEMVKYQKW